MRRPWEPIRPIRTRDDLIELIMDAVRLHLRELNEDDARAVAESVLQAFKMEHLAIRQRR